MVSDEVMADLIVRMRAAAGEYHHAITGADADIIEALVAENAELRREWEACEIQNGHIIDASKEAWAKHGGMEIAKGQWMARAEIADAEIAALKANARIAIDAGEVMIGTLTTERNELRGRVAELESADTAWRKTFERIEQEAAKDRERIATAIAENTDLKGQVAVYESHEEGLTARFENAEAELATARAEIAELRLIMDYDLGDPAAFDKIKKMGSDLTTAKERIAALEGAMPVAYASEKVLRDLAERTDDFRVTANLWRHPRGEWNVPLYRRAALSSKKEHTP